MPCGIRETGWSTVLKTHERSFYFSKKIKTFNYMTLGSSDIDTHQTICYFFPSYPLSTTQARMSGYWPTKLKGPPSSHTWELPTLLNVSPYLSLMVENSINISHSTSSLLDKSFIAPFDFFFNLLLQGMEYFGF